MTFTELRVLVASMLTKLIVLVEQLMFQLELQLKTKTSVIKTEIKRQHFQLYANACTKFTLKKSRMKALQQENLKWVLET